MENRRSRPRTLADLFLSAAFVAIVSAPLVCFSSRLPARYFGETDPAARPAFRTFAWKSIFFQGLLVRWNAAIRVSLLGASTTPRVVLGKEGWRYYRTELEALGSPARIGDARLVAWVKNAIEAEAACRARGIPYVLFVCPDKATAHPEHLPDWVRRAPGPSRLDLLLETLRTRLPAGCAPDLRPLLAAVKDEGPTYFRADSHWTPFGALTALGPALDTIRARLPEVEPLPRPRLERSEDTVVTTDLQHVLGLETATETLVEASDPVKREAFGPDGTRLRVRIHEGTVSHRMETRCPDARAGTLLVIRDSFGVALMDPLAKRFRRAVFVLSPGFRQDLLDEVRPDAVIQQFVERRIFQETPDRILVE